MATVVAVASGNWSDTSGTSPWPGGVKPAVGDTVQSGAFVVEIDEDIAVALLEATDVGYFAVSAIAGDGTRTILADVLNSGTAYGALEITAETGDVVLTGNVTGGSAESAYGVLNTGTLTTLTGNVTDGSGDYAYGVLNAGTLTTLTGAIGSNFVCRNGVGGLTPAATQPTGQFYVNGALIPNTIIFDGSNPYRWRAIPPVEVAGATWQVWITATIEAIETLACVWTRHLASSGGGTADWTTGEKEQIRDALGVTGDKTAATGGQLQDIPTITEFEARTVPSADYFAPASDTVLLAAAQNGVEFTGQVKITANVANQGALHIVNAHAEGRGLHNQGGYIGQFNDGEIALFNSGDTYGARNEGVIPIWPTGLTDTGVRGAIGLAAANLDAQLTALPTDGDIQAAAAAALTAYGVALETTLTAIKGVGWTTETLKALGTLLTAISGKTTNLPSDPADQSQVEAAITASQAAILAAIVPAIPVAAPTLADIRAGIITDHGVGSYQRESGVGIHAYVYTVTDAISGLPLDGVYVWVTLTNNASEDPPQASGNTIADGTVTVHLDPGWYYFWKQLAGWNAPSADHLEVS
jgi:hypothetical protein